MPSFDFDCNIQKIFKSRFSELQKTDWKKWLELDSNEEYEELILNNSGLSNCDDLCDKIREETTNSRSFSKDLESFVASYDDSDPFVMCHTSGTTNSKISALKWFHMSDDIIRRFWAPGMQAIFESSGLNRNSSAVIFVPSRIALDGLKTIEDKSYISLYSSEFSQRIMLSIIKPAEYLFFEYKNSKNLSVILKILDLPNISVISAPAATVLGWADILKLEDGLRKSINLLKEDTDEIKNYLRKIEREGINTVAKELRDELSNKLSQATLVFSISSLSEKDWDLIRTFMRWERGKERFTNLYVASEVGPFAASITNDDYTLSRLNRMYVFPLVIPVLEQKGKKMLITQCKEVIGKLYVSRINEGTGLFNIDIGDVVHLADKGTPLPQISGKILRSSFKLKYEVKFSEEIRFNQDYSVYAGDYFTLGDFEIYEPRLLLECLRKDCNYNGDAVVLLNKKENNLDNWALVVKSNSDCQDATSIVNLITKCGMQNEFFDAIRKSIIKIKPISKEPVNFLTDRTTILRKVRNGEVPKGILKKWPLYLISPKNF